MILDDALTQAKKAFSQITSQAGQAVTSATRNVGNYFQPQQLQSPIPNQQSFQPSQFSQNVSSVARSVAPSLPFGIGNAIQGFNMGQQFANTPTNNPRVNAFKQALPNLGNQAEQSAINNPVFKSLGPVGEFVGRTYGAGAKSMVNAFTSPLQNKSLFGHAGDIAGGLGAITAPGESITGGLANVGFNAAGNVLGGRNPLANVGQAYSQGIDFTNKLSGIGKFTAPILQPILTKLSPEVKGGVNTFLKGALNATGEERTQLLKQAAGYVARKLGSEGIQGGVSMGLLGSTAPAANSEERLFNTFSQAIQGAEMSMAIGGFKMIGEVGGLGVKEGVNASRLQQHNNFIDSAIEAQKQIESGQPRTGGGRYGSMLDVPLLHVSLSGGQEIDIKPSMLESHPEWRQSVTGPGTANQPAQLLWSQAHSGGFIKPSEFLPGSKTIAEDKQNPESFTQSLGDPDSQLPNEPGKITQLESPQTTEAMQEQQPPPPGLSPQELSKQSQLPGEKQISPGSTPQQTGSSLNVSSNGSVTDPVKQQQIDDAFAKVKISGKETSPNELVGAIKNLFDPISGTVNGADIKNAFREHRATFDLAASQAAKDSQDLSKTWDKISPQDHLKFIQGIESGNPVDIKGVDPGIAQKYQQRFADDYKIQQSIRPDAPFKENYFTQSGVWKDPKQAEQFYNKWQKGSLQGPEGFFEHSAFPTIYDGVKAGLDLKESNPETLYINNHINVLRSKMADDFMKETQTKGWDQGAVQSLVDRYMDPGIAGNPIYKTARAANAGINAFQLGLSAFHATTTTMNSFTSRMAQGIEELSQGKNPTRLAEGLKDIASTPLAPLQQFFRGNKMLQDAYGNNPQLSEDIQNVLKGGGQIGKNELYSSGAWDGMMKNVRQGKVLSAATKLPFAVLDKVASPIMDVLVPRLKLGAFAELAASKLQNLGDNATPEVQRAALSQAWDSVDNRFGQLVQDNLFWNKSFKDVLNMSTRSLGWNLGTVREIGGGAVNTLKAPGQIVSGKGIDSSTAYTLALPIVTGLTSAAYMYLHGQKPESITDLAYPRTGKMTTPKPSSPDQNSYAERVSIPGYMKDVVAFGKNPVQTLMNKQSPILTLASKVTELGSTGGIKDYYGNYAVNPSSQLLDKTKEIGSFAASQLLPFSLSGQKQRVTQSPESTAESFLGINPAPAAITKGNNADLINQSFNNNLTVNQSKKMFDLQKQGVDPQQYIKSVLNDRTTNKAAKTAGTDPASIKDQAVQSYLNGDPTQAKGLGLTITGLKSYISSKQLSAADALVSGDKQTSDTILSTYKTQIPPKILMRASADRAMTLLQQAQSFARTGDTKDRDIILSQFDQLKQQYPFQFTQADKLKLSQILQ